MCMLPALPELVEHSCWILDTCPGPRCHLGQKQNDRELNDDGWRTRTTTSVVVPQHGRLDRQSVQSRKSRYLMEDGVWRGLQVFQLHRRLQDCPFWESWLHTPDHHAHALVQVSGHSPDLDFVSGQVSFRFVLAHRQKQRGFPSGREAVTEVGQLRYMSSTLVTVRDGTW